MLLEFEKQIKSAFKNHGLSSILFRNMMSSKNILRYLKEVISDNEKIITVSNHSYKHENNFYKLLLYEDPELKYKIRLHLFNSKIEDSDVHNHAWSFTSKVLFGELQNNYFEVTSNIENPKYFHFKYEIDQTILEAKLTAQGTKHLRLLDTVLFKKNDINFQKHNILHKVCTTKKTATLIVHQEPFKFHSDVYKCMPKIILNQTHKTLSVYEVRDLLTMTIADI